MSFPTNPTNGQTASVNGKSYVYNATKDSWSVAVTTGSIPGSLITASGTVAGNLNTTGNLVVSNNASITGNATISGDVTADGITGADLTVSNSAGITGNLTVGGVLTNNYYYANGSAFSPGGGAAGSITTYATTASLPLSANAGVMAYVFSTNRLYIYNSGWYSIAAVTQTPTFSDTPGTTVNLGSNANSYSYTLVASDPEGIPLTYDFTVVSGLNANLASINSSTGVFTADFSSISDAQITFTASDGVNIASATSTFYYLDPEFEYTTLLLKAVGSNTQANSTFIDSSANNFTVTKNGDVIQGSFTPFYGNGYYSNYFDGTGDYLTAPYTTTNFDWWTSDYTFEAWVYPTVLSTWSYSDGARQRPVFAGNMTNDVDTDYWSFGPINDGTVRFYYYNGTGVAVTSTATVTENTWNHIAFTKTSSGITIFVNGVASTTTAISGTPQSSNAVPLTIGRHNANAITGYVSNLRIVKGTAIYSANFTPSTSPLSAVANTKFLACQSNRFVDNSADGVVISNFGDAKVTTFGPFNPAAIYSAATNGGSLYFDGSGDYLSMSYNAAFTSASGDFTVEQWVYPQRPANTMIAIGGIWDSISPAPQSWVHFINTSGKYVLIVDNSSGGTDTTIFTSSATIPNNSWTHIAFSRSGSTWRLFINGVLDTTTTNALTLSTGSNPYMVGYFSNPGGGDNPFKGFISNHRIVKGTAVYTANFTVPTAPLSAIANTSFLLLGTNAGIVDASRKHNVTTAGSAAASTVQKKFATENSISGAADAYVLAPASNELEFGSGNFTIEFWWYPTSTARQALYHGSFGIDWSLGIDYSSVSTNQKIGIWASSNGTAWNLINADPGGNGIGTTTVTQNAWNHIAFVRNGTTWMLFVNGNRDLNLTGISGSVVSRATYPKAIGTWFSSTAIQEQLGYIQDFRISKTARYTANFTIPASAFLTR